MLTVFTSLYVSYRTLNQNTKLRFTYTAMHGVGTRFVQMAMESFGLPPLILVKEQVWTKHQE